MTARILLVEDDPVSRDLLASLLSSKGFEVDTAADGFSGLRLTQEMQYDLVFVDYHLPEMDGYAFARLMRSLADKAEHPLKMIAITADQFGLAARRGVDAVFDKLLTKPIDPDVLYECVSSFLSATRRADATASAIDTFLSEPTTNDAQSASQVLWRVRGLGALPKAVVYPAPTASERQGLAYCFDLTEADGADCIVVLNASGLEEVAALRRSGGRYLLPMFGIGEDHRQACDAVFVVGDPQSWTQVADRIKTFRLRADALRPELRATAEPDLRLLAYLFVSERPITLRRDLFGRTQAAYAAGFDPEGVIASIKRLATQGLVASRLNDKTDDGLKELSIVLSGPGETCVCPRDAVLRR